MDKDLKSMPDKIFLNQNTFEWRDIDMGDPNDIRYTRATDCREVDVVSVKREVCETLGYDITNPARPTALAVIDHLASRNLIRGAVEPKYIGIDLASGEDKSVVTVRDNNGLCSILEPIEKLDVEQSEWIEEAIKNIETDVLSAGMIDEHYLQVSFYTVLKAAKKYHEMTKGEK